MNRRALIKSLGLAGLNVGLGQSFQAIATELNNPQYQGQSPAHAFGSSFQSVPESYGPTRVTFDPSLPTGLRGTLFRNGPAKMQRGDTRYHHWFDGDGMVHSFKLQNNALIHRAKMVRTDRLVEEEKAGRILRHGFGTYIEDSLPVLSPDDLNVANTSVLPLGDELLALWEAGSAWRLDPESLETLGRKVFSPQTDGVSFSAHPRTDPDGHLWNFGYLPGAGKLVIYDMSASGELKRTKVINAAHTNMVHDFAVTERFLVFVLMPVTIDEHLSGAFSETLGWEADSPVQVLLVDKANLAVQHVFELPPFFAFHFGNAWEDGKKLRIEVAIAEPLSEFNQSIRHAMAGKPAGPLLNSSSGRPLQALEIVLDLNSKTATTEPMPFVLADFPGFDHRYTGQKTTSLTMLTRSASISESLFGFNQISRFDRRVDSITEWDYGSDYIVEEHVFVPKPGAAEGKGWLLGTAFNWRKHKTVLTVFDAEHLQDGPIARCSLPYHLPLGFHGKFVSMV